MHLHYYSSSDYLFCQFSLLRYYSVFGDVSQNLGVDAAYLPTWFGRDYILVKPFIKEYKVNSLGVPVLNTVSIEAHQVERRLKKTCSPYQKYRLRFKSHSEEQSDEESLSRVGQQRDSSLAQNNMNVTIFELRVRKLQ